jgi:hypothetical protein
MTPHGMGDRPVPLSSTTEIKDVGERETAGLPRRASMANLRAAAESDETEGRAAKEKEDELKEEQTGVVAGNAGGKGEEVG